MDLFLEAIYETYGFDFRNYARSSLRRRIQQCVQQEKLNSISELQGRILHNRGAIDRFLLAVSVDVTSMFRDPDFFLALRQKVLPLIRDVPFIRIWDAGCSTGAEVMSLSILLQEEGLYEKCRIYATDFTTAIIDKAKEGIFPLKAVQEYTQNYMRAGGTKEFSSYYTAKYKNAIFRRSLQKNVVWGEHNLVSDASLNEFHFILCRNVMIYFNETLQEHVHRLLYESLAPGGVLGLGDKEMIHFSPFAECYGQIDPREKLFRKVR